MNSNRADLELLESAGLKRPVRPKKKKTLRQVAWMVRAMIKMKKRAGAWGEKRKLDERIKAKVEQQKRIGMSVGIAVRKSITSGR